MTTASRTPAPRASSSSEPAPSGRPETLDLRDRSNPTGDLAHLAVSGISSQAAAKAVVAAAKRRTDGVQHASLVLVRHGRVVVSAASDETATQLEAVQVLGGRGPSHDAAAGADLVAAPDLTLPDRRWRGLAPAMAQRFPRGAPGVVSVGLPGHERAALSLWGAPGSVLRVDRHEARETAGVVALALAAVVAHERAEQMQQALQSNRRIGTAMGILMHRRRVTEQAAFELLRQASQLQNRKLADVALDVVEQGDLPAPQRAAR